jgi:hypothetical protein
MALNYKGNKIFIYAFNDSCQNINPKPHILNALNKLWKKETNLMTPIHGSKRSTQILDFIIWHYRFILREMMSDF